MSLSVCCLIFVGVAEANSLVVVLLRDLLEGIFNGAVASKARALSTTELRSAFGGDCWLGGTGGGGEAALTGDSKL